MNIDVPRALLVLALAVAAVVLFVRASGGGGPLYYFASAVCFGMAFAAFQAARGAGGGSDARGGKSSVKRTGTGAGKKGGGGR